MKLGIFCIFFGLLLVSCGSIKPEAPEIMVRETIEIPEQPMSVIKVPIKVNLAPYFELTNKEVPTEFSGGEHPCSGTSYDYYFKRKPIEFKGIGKELKFDVDGAYSMKVSYCPECTFLLSSTGNCIIPTVSFSCGIGEPLRKMEISFKSEIGVTSDYHLTSKTKLYSVKAISPCKVTMFNYNATETVEKEVTKALKTVEKDIDKAIASVDLRPEMETTWNALSMPIDLTGYGFMFLNPKAVSMSNIRYYGDTAYFDAYLQAFPEVNLQNRSIETSKLPRLEDFVVSEGFDIKMDITATYDSLSSLLSRNISGKRTEVKGREVIFGAVNIFGASDQKLHIQLEFSGKKSGTIFLTGTPQFDAKKQTISFPDLEFDIASKSALLKSAKWFFDKKITEMIRTSTTMDLGTYLNEFKKTIGKSLNGEINTGVFMKGKVDEIYVDFIYPREDALFMRVSSRGSLGIRM